jgi:hypothetical protein
MCGRPEKGIGTIRLTRYEGESRLLGNRPAANREIFTVDEEHPVADHVIPSRLELRTTRICPIMGSEPSELGSLSWCIAIAAVEIDRRYRSFRWDQAPLSAAAYTRHPGR